MSTINPPVTDYWVVIDEADGRPMRFCFATEAEACGYAYDHMDIAYGQMLRSAGCKIPQHLAAKDKLAIVNGIAMIIDPQWKIHRSCVHCVTMSSTF